MKYKCILITRESDHEAVSRIDDEEMLIVEDENGNWYEAEEFFNVKGEMEFEVSL